MKQQISSFDKLEKRAKFLLWFGLAGILILPFLLTRDFGWISFVETGTIGDTIGGLTAPVIGSVSAILLFLSFKEQLRANKLLAEQISRTKTEDYLAKVLEHLEEIVNQLRIENVKGFAFLSHLTGNIHHDYFFNHRRFDQTVTQSNLQDLNYLLKIMKEVCDRIQREKLSDTVEFIQVTYWYNRFLIPLEEQLKKIKSEEPIGRVPEGSVPVAPLLPFYIAKSIDEILLHLSSFKGLLPREETFEESLIKK